MSTIDLDLFDGKGQGTQSNVSTVYLIIAMMIVVLLFILIWINNLWVFVALGVLVSGFLAYDKHYKWAIGFFLLMAVITVWQFVLTPIIWPKSKCKTSGIPIITTCPSEDVDNGGGNGSGPGCPSEVIEDFYTLFTPFHREAEAMKHIDTTALSAKATNLWRTRKKKLVFGGYDRDVDYVNMVSRLLLSRARILEIQQVWEHQPEMLVKDVATEKVDMALVPSPVVERGRQGILPGHPNKKFGNIQFLANVAHYYLYCISSIVSGIQNIHQLERKRVGIPIRMRSIWEDIHLSIFPSGHKGRLVFKTDNELFHDLKNHQIDAFFWSGTYPNPFIDGIILSENTHKYQLVPVMFQDEKAFTKEHVQYFPSVLDLTHQFMPSRYLPTGLGRIWMTNYTAQYWTFGFDLALICNDKMDNFTGFEIAKTIFGGRNLIARQFNRGRQTDIRINNYDQTWHNQNHPLTPADIARPSLPKIPVQEGAKKFYVSKGMIGYCQEPGCMQVIGVEECKLCDPEVKKTEMQWRDVLMQEKAIPKHFAAVPFKDVMGSPDVLKVTSKDYI